MATTMNLVPDESAQTMIGPAIRSNLSVTALTDLAFPKAVLVLEQALLKKTNLILHWIVRFKSRQ